MMYKASKVAQAPTRAMPATRKLQPGGLKERLLGRK